MAMNKKLEESYEGAAAVVRRAPRASHLDRELPLAYPDLGRAMYALIRGGPLDDPRLGVRAYPAGDLRGRLAAHTPVRPRRRVELILYATVSVRCARNRKVSS